VTSNPFGCIKSETLDGVESLNLENHMISVNELLASIAVLVLFEVSSVGDVIDTKSGITIVGTI